MDISYLLFLQNIREAFGGVFDSFMMELTALGEGIITYLVLAAVYWCLDKRSGQYMGLNVALACTMNQFLKAVFRVDRPWIRDERIHPVEASLAGAGGYSFPSGHTQRAAAVWGALGVSLWKKKERLISIICFSILSLVAFSRNYLGVHTPQDVLFALALGVLCFWLLDKAMLWAGGGNSRDILIAGIGCMICFLPMLKVGCLSNAGAGMGFFIGWVLERHFIRFKTEGSCVHKCVRFAIGSIGIIYILKVLQDTLKLFIEAKYAGFFANFSLAVFIMAVYPFFFDKKERYKAGAVLLAVLLIGISALSFVHQTKNSGTDAETETIEQQAGNAESRQDEQQTADAAAVSQLPQIIAHRGYSGIFPENTMAAFEGAIDIGADYIELDVQPTADGQIIICHDGDLKRVAGVEKLVTECTYEELSQLDVGSWFSASFAGERLPLLSEALKLIGSSDMKIYLELKDVGEHPGFVEAVAEAVKQQGLEENCVFASFNYGYLKQIKAVDEKLRILYNTTSGKVTIPEEFPAEYYGLYTESITAATVKSVHDAGKKAFVWTVNTPQQMVNMLEMGVDGIVTNYPGLAKVVVHPEYAYLAEHFEKSLKMPGLYEPEWKGKLDDYVVQGLTKAGNQLVVSAYSYSGEQNSILYIMGLDGSLRRVVDLGFKAHTGGIAYDEAHDLLWVTGPSGRVYAVSWAAVNGGSYQGEIVAEFDAGLLNHNSDKVASFLNLYHGALFVGSYVNGDYGCLKRYDITDPLNPVEISVVTIPERIQGVTFKVENGVQTMLLSQGYQTEDAHLLKFRYKEELDAYTEPKEVYTMPEGIEQIQMTTEGMYILFESAVRPYRETARIPNDQIYLVRE